MCEVIRGTGGGHGMCRRKEETRDNKYFARIVKKLHVVAAAAAGLIF
jgi:hypothetical protein